MRADSLRPERPRRLPRSQISAIVSFFAGGLVAARPRVNDWYARMTSRPAYASAMPPAGSDGSQPAPA